MQWKALEIGNSLHRGPAGELEGVSFTRTHERQIKEGSRKGTSLSLSLSLSEGNLEGGLLLLGTLKDMYSKALQKVVYLHRVPNGEHGGEVPLPGL
jgi:hypothetical protein